jgi:branched-chain amino acid transport system substrate-binding protein
MSRKKREITMLGDSGNWSEARVLQVQFQNIRTGDLSEFKEPGIQVVVWPPEPASGSPIYPYANAKRASRGSREC